MFNIPEKKKYWLPKQEVPCSNPTSNKNLVKFIVTTLVQDIHHMYLQAFWNKGRVLLIVCAINSCI